MGKNNLYYSPLGISQNNVIHSSSFQKIKEWRDEFLAQMDELVHEDEPQNDEKKIVAVFKKTLTIKFNTYYLLELLDMKKRGLDTPVFRKDLRFMVRASALLDKETFDNILQLAEDKSVPVENPFICNNTAKDPVSKPLPAIKKPNIVLFNKSLGITSDDVLETNDIELLTTWLADIYFQLYWMKKSTENQMKHNAIKSIQFTCQLKYLIIQQLNHVTDRMRKEAGISFPGNTKKERNCIASRFMTISKKLLPADIYAQILEESRLENWEKRNGSLYE